MTTKYTVNLLNLDNSVDSVFGNFDGYLLGAGLELFRHFNDSQKVQELVALGSICLLKANLYPDTSKLHCLSSPQKNICSFYLRDENIVDYGSLFNLSEPAKYYATHKFDNLSSFVESKKFDKSFNYLFCLKTHNWFFIDPESKELTLLEDKLLSILNEPKNIRQEEKLEKFKQAQIIAQHNKLSSQLAPPNSPLSMKKSATKI